MSSTTQTRPVVTLYPSTQEDASAYMAAIRLASSVRNSMDAQKAGVDGEKASINPDSFARHPPPPSATGATGGRNPDLTLNQTSSAHSAVNTTKSGFGPSQDRYPSPSQSMSTPTLEHTAVYTSAGVEPTAMERHHGHFPPPEPPIGANGAPPAKPISGRTGPIPIDMNQSPGGLKPYLPGGIRPECQLYTTNTELNNVTFAVCPVIKRTSNTKSYLASRQLYSGDVSSSNTLALRGTTAMCDAPTGFDQRLACGRFDVWFVIAFFMLLSVIGLAWMTMRHHSRSREIDEENSTASWPRASINASTNSPKAKSKVSTHGPEAERRERVRRAHTGGDQRLQEEFSTEQYEPAAWRRGAARANFEGRVEYDAGPVAVLPSCPRGGACLPPF